MNRRSFIKLFGSMSLLGLAPVRALLSLMESEKTSAILNGETSFTPEQMDALQKIKHFEAQLQQGGQFSWFLHNELRHYWGAFSEVKSLSHANIILEYSIMDFYIMNTLSDWHYAPEYQPRQPELALASLQRRADEYPELHYMSVACWLRAGEISSAIGDRVSTKEYYQHAINVSKKYKQRALRLSIYQGMAQSRLTASL